MRKAGICPAFFVLFEKEQFFVHLIILVPFYARKGTSWIVEVDETGGGAKRYWLLMEVS